MSAAAMIAALVGCVDPGKNFDDFNGRVGTTDASTTDRPPSTLVDITGTFLVAVHAGFETSNDPAYYVQMLVDWTLTEGDTATLDGSYTPLCTNAACAQMREMIPPPLRHTDPVAADGSFEQAITGTLPGGANPLSGSAQPLMGLLHGIILDANTACGTVSGTVAGLDLAGSTFGAIRVTDSTPGALPAPRVTCEN